MLFYRFRCSDNLRYSKYNICMSLAFFTQTFHQRCSLETLVLVSRRLEDMKNGLGLGLEIKVLVLVLVLKKKSWSWSWRKSLNIFKTLMNDKNYKPHYKNYKFVPAFVLLWQSSNPSCSAAINEWLKREMWQMVVDETNIHSIRYWIKTTKLHDEWNEMDICITNNHLPNFSFKTSDSLLSESETNV